MKQNLDSITKKMLKAYKRLALGYEKTVKSHDYDEPYITAYLRLFSPGARIADVGAGTGTIAHRMQHDFGFDVVATDISPDMLGLARQKYPDLPIAEMDYRDMHFSDAIFDGVFANYAFIHEPDGDVKKGLQEMARITKLNGYLYISVQEPLPPNLEAGYYPVVYDQKVELYINPISEERARQMLQAVGYKVLHVARRPPQIGMEFEFSKLFIVAQKQA